MRIESIIRRQGGTYIKLGDTLYHFTSDGKDPRHIAEVTDPAHLQRFLSITEGYRPADAVPKAKAKAADPTTTEGNPAGTDGATTDTTNGAGNGAKNGKTGK